jgi:hypothetical protein
MDTPRNVYKIDKNNPGSDVAAETAAALAAASLAFKKIDPIYSKTLLTRAINVSNSQNISCKSFNCIRLIFKFFVSGRSHCMHNAGLVYSHVIFVF